MSLGPRRRLLQQALSAAGLLAGLRPAAAQAPGAAASSASGAAPLVLRSGITRLALVSRLGDRISNVTYRKRLGTFVEANDEDVQATGSPVLDHLAMNAIATRAQALLPGAEIATLAVPAPGSAFDPELLLSDTAALPSRPALTALRQQGFAHLLLLGPHRAPTRIQMAASTFGSGYLSGLGFYTDHEVSTIDVEKREEARGFIAPFVYARLSLLDTRTGAVLKEVFITRTEVHASQRADADQVLSPAERALRLRELMERALRRGTAEVLARD